MENTITQDCYRTLLEYVDCVFDDDYLPMIDRKPLTKDDDNVQALMSNLVLFTVLFHNSDIDYHASNLINEVNQIIDWAEELWIYMPKLMAVGITEMKSNGGVAGPALRTMVQKAGRSSHWQLKTFVDALGAALFYRFTNSPTIDPKTDWTGACHQQAFWLRGEASIINGKWLGMRSLIPADCLSLRQLNQIGMLTLASQESCNNDYNTQVSYVTCMIPDSALTDILPVLHKLLEIQNGELLIYIASGRMRGEMQLHEGLVDRDWSRVQIRWIKQIDHETVEEPNIYRDFSDFDLPHYAAITVLNNHHKLSISAQQALVKVMTSSKITIGVV